MKYATAFSAKEALEHLINAEGNGIVIAGGTDVMVDYKDKRINPAVLVDVTKCEDMKGIAIEGDKIVIGASTTLTEIARSPIINKYYPSLAKGAGTVGSLQIRNSGTLTGNVVSAQPAGDAAMAVAPLDPIFTVLSAEGTREMTMAVMYKGFGKSHIDHSKEIVTKITLPSTITSVGDYAFADCAHLRFADAGSAALDETVFAGCPDLVLLTDDIETGLASGVPFLLR